MMTNLSISSRFPSSLFICHPRDSLRRGWGSLKALVDRIARAVVSVFRALCPCFFRRSAAVLAPIQIQNPPDSLSLQETAREVELENGVGEGELFIPELPKKVQIYEGLYQGKMDVFQKREKNESALYFCALNSLRRLWEELEKGGCLAREEASSFIDAITSEGVHLSQEYPHCKTAFEALQSAAFPDFFAAAQLEEVRPQSGKLRKSYSQELYSLWEDALLKADSKIRGAILVIEGKVLWLLIDRRTQPSFYYIGSPEGMNQSHPSIRVFNSLQSVSHYFHPVPSLERGDQIIPIVKRSL